MMRRLLLLLPISAALLALSCWLSWHVSAQTKRPPRAATPQWIWFNEGDPLSSAPAESRYFRRVVVLPPAFDAARLEVTADNAFVVWVNGNRIGQGDNWANLSRFNVKKYLVAGKNAIAVEAKNDGGPAGLVVRLRYTPRGKASQVVVSDGSWRVSKASAPGWTKADFDDSKWSKARVLGAYGKVGPWGNGGGGGTPADPAKMTLVDGFKVVPAVKNPGDRGAFSLVNMTFDAQGRLLVSQEGGSILLCTAPDKEGVLQNVAEYCTQVKNCQGMCWVDDALWLVGNGPKGTGLYRCRDSKNADRIDEVTLIHRFDGGMGEHGPHAVIHGPDNAIYVVIGNHAHAVIGKKAPNPTSLASNSPLVRWQTGGQGVPQGKPGSTEDVLLPRLNDANGHASNLLAPGGTIWRFDKQGKNPALVAAGFRNEFDAAFNPAGELFSFDSDMEWDEKLPWYRPVRAVHCPPGAEFGWRTGSSKIPPYSLDTLPALADTGRGSPVGVTFYDHSRFGPDYRGAFFMADWSLGIIYAVHLKPNGATYDARVEKFCTGRPMPVSDLEVAPDGSLVFTTGGRGTAGGVFRIVPESKKATNAAKGDQPLAAWSRAARQAEIAKLGKDKVTSKYLATASDSKLPGWARVRALNLLHSDSLPLNAEKLAGFASNADPQVRAQAIWLMGVRRATEPALLAALRDKDAMVRRRACEACIRTGLKPNADTIWPLLGDADRFVRTAAPLVLQRIDAKNWADRIGKETKEEISREAIVALYKTGKLAEHSDVVFAFLAKSNPKERTALLGHLRVIQLACIAVPKLPAIAKEIAASCDKQFPHPDPMVNRELAILLTQFSRSKVLKTPVVTKLLDAMDASAGDRPQQIHYFYCLRLLSDGWTPDSATGKTSGPTPKARLAAWYNATQSWTGGASFTGFLRNIYRQHLETYTVADREAILARADKLPYACQVLCGQIGEQRQATLIPALRDAIKHVEATKPKNDSVMRAMREALVLCACDKPTKESFDDLVYGLSSPNKVILFEAIAALSKIDASPKKDDAKPYRAVLMAVAKLDPGNRWKAVELLRHWSAGRQFGAEKGQWQKELASWSRWFGQTFPKEPALPVVVDDKATPSKYRFSDLLNFLTKGEGKSGDVMRGKKVFEKAQCAKCHKFGKEGEGLGPDLSALAKRFKRVDILESVYYPSKVISDQYRSTSIVTMRGQRIDGLAAIQGDTITVQMSDGTKTMLRKRDIDQQFSSLVSVMPEKLLDTLSKQEIADLFAFLESEPAK